MSIHGKIGTNFWWPDVLPDANLLRFRKRRWNLAISSAAVEFRLRTLSRAIEEMNFLPVDWSMQRGHIFLLWGKDRGRSSQWENPILYLEHCTVNIQLCFYIVSNISYKSMQHFQVLTNRYNFWNNSLRTRLTSSCQTCAPSTRPNWSPRSS